MPKPKIEIHFQRPDPSERVASLYHDQLWGNPVTAEYIHKVDSARGSDEVCVEVTIDLEDQSPFTFWRGEVGHENRHKNEFIVFVRSLFTVFLDADYLRMRILVKPSHPPFLWKEEEIVCINQQKNQDELAKHIFVMYHQFAKKMHNRWS